MKAPDGSTRANLTTIAKHLKTSPDTVARHAERLEKLGLIEIHEYQGPKDERDRKYIHVKEEKLSTIEQITDPDNIVPKQGGNRYICPKCDSTNVAIKKVTTLRCLDCNHEKTVDDTGWVEQNGHKAQKQDAFKKSKHTQAPPAPEEQTVAEAQKQLAEQCVGTLGYSGDSAEKQVAFEELKALKIWCPHRAKVPYQIHGRSPQKAKPNDPATWSTYEVALATYQESQSWKYPYDGIGIMNNGDYTLLDLDKCRDKETGKISAEACAMVRRFQTYWEISQSGTGLHGIARGSIPAGVKEEGVIEMYPNNRFFVWTGNHLDGTTDTIEDCDQKLNALYSELRPVQEESAAQPAIDDTELDDKALQAILEKARNGKKGARFRILYDEGNWEKAGFKSQSNADASLCNDLAFWSENNVSAIDRLFRQSKLMRPKWDRKARSGETYGEGTIRRALVRRKEQAA